MKNENDRKKSEFIETNQIIKKLKKLNNESLLSSKIVMSILLENYRKEKEMIIPN